MCKGKIHPMSISVLHEVITVILVALFLTLLYELFSDKITGLKEYSEGLETTFKFIGLLLFGSIFLITTFKYLFNQERFQSMFPEEKDIHVKLYKDIENGDTAFLDNATVFYFQDFQKAVKLEGEKKNHQPTYVGKIPYIAKQYSTLIVRHEADSFFAMKNLDEKMINQGEIIVRVKPIFKPLKK